MRILTNIWRIKDNQLRKIGSLIEYNMRNVLLKNHAQNAVEILFPDHFLKNQNWAYIGSNNLTFYIQFGFIVC